MINTIIVIVISVTIFGLVIFFLVKRTLEKKIKYNLSKNKKK
jgi:uncharacterized protein YneF (UPF0154 family)